MKKSAFVMIVALAICLCFSICASALDTPWIPIKPDTQATESVSPSVSESDITSNENGDHTDTSVEGVSDTDSGIEKNDTTAEATEKNASGCESALNESMGLVCILAVSVCVIRSRKENE